MLPVYRMAVVLRDRAKFELQCSYCFCIVDEEQWQRLCSLLNFLSLLLRGLNGIPEYTQNRCFRQEKTQHTRISQAFRWTILATVSSH